MNTFHLFLEIFLYAFGIFILLKKDELGIVYLPVLFFTDTVLGTHAVTALAYYALVSIILLQLIRKNPGLFSQNIFAAFLVLYFLLLMTRVPDLTAIRQDIFNVLWFFLSLPLIAAIYRKYPKGIILKELYRSCALILSIFILSVLAATYFKYNPYEMYGISSGLLFGNLYATDFNIVAIAVFIVLLCSLHDRNLIYLAIVVVSLSFIGLSMRRSVMAVTGIGIAIVMLLYISKNLKKLLLFITVGFMVSFIIITKTTFTASFMERYELRNLEERSLNEEQRLFEYQLLYDDVVQYKRYSPLVGYQLFNSPGNYGAGRFYDRSLHGDLTSLFHSGGLIAVALYLFAIMAAFYSSFKHAHSWNDKLLIAFCVIAFVTYCGTGRFTQVGTMVLLFLLAQFPLAATAREATPRYRESNELQVAGA